MVNCGAGHASLREDSRPAETGRVDGDLGRAIRLRWLEDWPVMLTFVFVQMHAGREHKVRGQLWNSLLYSRHFSA